ncbi:MAG: STAS domain-containing protein [Chitinivibrionales bacterium]|nr:STAS domain-containing protein [Chitinivibrionales bacterium]
MDIVQTSFDSYNVHAIEGEIRLPEIPRLAPHFTRHIEEYPGKNLVLDLSKVNVIDSSAFRLIINLQKRMENSSTKLYILTPSDTVKEMIESVNLNKVLTLIDNCEGLQKEAITSEYDRYRSCTEPDKQFAKLSCSCGVCGSKDVIGYLIDANEYDWKWKGADPFPIAYPKGTDEEINAMGHMPIICMECYMASPDVWLFNGLVKDKITAHSRIDGESKLVLSKGIKARKKMVDDLGSINEMIFRYPREKEACYYAWLLSEKCARSLAVNKKVATPFTIAYLNYLTIRYATTEQKKELIDGCRTWVTQVLNNKSDYTHTELAKSYFILMNASLNLEKIKEASQAFQQFEELTETLPENLNISGPESPHFWFDQAKIVWKREINARSSELSAKPA